jgi:ABC-type multidrug transport system ATPase subunit
MEVRLERVSRHFYYRWVFKNLSYTFQTPVWYSITGHNGSGKSTLLQVISGFLSPSKGQITYHQNKQELPLESGYQYVSIATPYLDLVEEFSPEEHLNFHSTFKSLKPSITIDHILRATGLLPHRKKAIKFFSSGMVQRLRLAQALYFDTPLVLLDEPTSHLDQQGVAWYQELLKTRCQDQCVIIASNNPADYQQCSFELSIETYKPAVNSS